MRITTLCYITHGEKTLMLHRTKKESDENAGKWIGIGGHLEEGESPEDCLVREVREETGLTLTSFSFRGLVTFVSDEWGTEYMCLFSGVSDTEEITDCEEGELRWIETEKLGELPMWEGDRIFLKLLDENRPFFDLSLVYQGDSLKKAMLDGVELTLPFDFNSEL